ncbi:tyrosine decarboxylase MfnA [Methanosalsum natronophilum]|uniref:tyrosine decarboxylase MfnA n=1 Tax=Methanosalsum natronophilum TaxID=768733 RepID=UPI002166F3F7|nr:tyrosine decarboxylase MfnA [Methanosalsum natronophilum]MCS3923946.1 tyrosine decarboxylase/aspartate 1-decarboxylase [Methanosalsum natronophilum]
MKHKGLEESNIIKLLKQKKKSDIGFNKVLSTMCTKPHPIAIKAHLMFIESNIGDSGLFPGTSSMENTVITSLSQLLNNKNAYGYITTGGTESNIQALRSIKNISDSTNPNIIVPESAHFSFDKISNLLDIEIKKASLDNSFKVDLKSVKKLIDHNTIALVGIAGTTEFGQIDPIESLSEIAIKNKLFLHIDAAFGGFVIPFLDKKYIFDFLVPGVTSISLDPHKMGFSTIPSGVILFRNKMFLDNLETSTPYLTSKSQYSLTGTRTGATVAATFAVLKYLGQEGYSKYVEYCMYLTNKLISGAHKIQIYPLIDPVMNVVVLQVNKPEEVRNYLREKYGWYVSITRNPKCLRIILMPHITENDVEHFLIDLEKTVEYLK